MNNKAVLLFAIFVMFFGSAYASTVSRNFSETTVEIDSNVTVTLTVDITGSETYYAIDESIPTGWTVAYADNEPDSIQQSGHIKLVVIENATNTTHTYILTAPNQAETTTFLGIYMLEGMNNEAQISGENQVTVASDSCATDDDCPSQICCSRICINPACSLNSDCDDGDACTTDSCGDGGTCTAACSNTPIEGCGEEPEPASGPGGGSSGGGGDTGNRLTINIEGSCLRQPITITVLNQQGNPLTGAFTRVTKNRTTVETKTTNQTGKNTFVFEEPGEYTIYTTKPGYHANTKTIQVRECKPPTAHFEQEIKTGQTQTITLTTDDGNTITDFNVLITYPNNTTALLEAKDGAIILPAEEAGTYTATVTTTDFQTTVNFEATTPMQIIPNIKPDARPVVSAVLGEETVQTPNYLIIWILAVAIISGLIIEITKVKPGWFRIFMATTYTTLPLVVNYYTNIWIAFATIAIQTVILTALYFNQWRIKKALQAISKLENN